MATQAQVLFRQDVAITSPTFGPQGDLFTIGSNGDICRYVGLENAEMEAHTWGDSSGQPFGLVFNSSGSAFVCDAAHQAIFRITRTEGEDGVPRQQIEPYVREYEQAQFLGPNSLCLSRNGMLYFTDSGPFGETSLQNPRGSVFAISSATQLLIPLCLHTLSHPCGVALSPDEKNIYVAETGMNRVLRFSQHPPGVFHCSVFHQLSGRFGPTALTVRDNGDIFVAHFDFADNTDNGKVLVLDSEGEVIDRIILPGAEVTGLCLTPDQRYLLITEKSTTSLYRHPLA
jgi:aspartate beta-hydroxylase